MEGGEAFVKSDFANNLCPDRPGIASANRSAVGGGVTHGGNTGKCRAIESREVKQVSERTSFNVPDPRRRGDKLGHIAQRGDSCGVVLMY